MSPVLEDRLRDLFAATTQNAPSADDPATRAIARARVVRRRRLTVASTAAVLLFGTSVYGLGAFQGGGGTSPTGMLPNGAAVEAPSVVPSPPAVAEAERGPDVSATAEQRDVDGRPTGIDLDIRAGDRLWTTGGSIVTLTGVGSVTRAYRVAIGWVYGGEHGVRLLLLEDGTTKALSGNGDDWALDPAGERITFVADGRLHVGAVTTRGLAVTAGAPIAAGVRPVGFVGDSVLVRADTGGYALVDPAAPAEPAFDTRVLTVLGPRADGATTALVREAGGDRVCLARLAASAAKLTIGTTGGCTLGLTVDGDPGVRLSADGSHVYQAGDDGFRMAGVDDVLGGDGDTAVCAAPAGTAAVWISADTLLAGADRVAVTCRADGTRDTVALPADVGAGWQYVPRLGAVPGSRTG
ncbi:hypothetical protein J2S43_006440 [Catenuloplanes nepalensis]|uniref:Uncharacterized protein n=1 Tax=Catenuloplanes nepalensis TaxID=587533 RepID=A0ABT9N350_9ACTN|nr:hypothetical protein [Catenuloplanes nepalensis]MDP9797928.1 hypothetical protein [Catenuloplanes nepalensis]